MKTLLVTGLSVVLSAAVIGNAYYQKKQFYPSVVYITKSNPSMAVRNDENDDVLQELSFWGSISIWQITLVTHLLVSFSTTTIDIDL